VKNCNEVKKVLISAQEIQIKVEDLAKNVTRDYAGKRPLVVGVLKGAWIFLADLLRKAELDLDVDFICVSSYGNRTYSSGKVDVLKDLTMECRGRDVLLVEDIIDSGITLSHIKELLFFHGAKSVEIAALLSKPSRRKVSIDVKYLGFEIPDEFVVGYGMDYQERFRTLKDICILNEEVYKR